MFSKRGRECTDFFENLLFRLLVLLKYDCEWNFCAAMFRKKSTKFGRLTIHLITTVVFMSGKRFIAHVQDDNRSLPYLKQIILKVFAFSVCSLRYCVKFYLSDCSQVSNKFYHVLVEAIISTRTRPKSLSLRMAMLYVLPGTALAPELL